MRPEPAKRAISLEEENEKDKEWLKDKLAQANRQVENDLAGAFISYPTDPNSDLYKAFADAALSWLKYQRAIFLADKNGEETALKEYDRIIEGLKTLAKSNADLNKQPTILISKDPRDTKMTLPTQSSIFAFDDYA